MATGLSRILFEMPGAAFSIWGLLAFYRKLLKQNI